MNNTELIDIFRENLRDDIEIKPSKAGPIVLGGKFTKHFNTHFKVDEKIDEWTVKAVSRLAMMVSQFPNPIQFYQLGDPLRDCEWDTLEDPEVVIRRYHKFMPELWTEPADHIDPDDFTSRKKWDDHTKVVYEVVFIFGERQNDLSY